MSISKLSAVCRACPHRDTCSNKRMEAQGSLQPSAEPISETVAASILRPHDYRHIKIDTNTTVTIDLEDLKKERIYRSIGVPFIGTQYGA